MYKYLKNNYKKVEPIFIEDLFVEGVSRDKVKRILKQLVELDMLRKYNDEVYYLPKKRFIGEESLKEDDVIKYKYLERNNKKHGYYTGHILAYKLGMIKTRSSLTEIVSNNIKEDKEFMYGTFTDFLIKKSRVIIDENNCRILQFLDLLSQFDEIVEDVNYAKVKLIEFIRDNKIRRKDIDNYISVYPVKVYKNFYKLRLEEVLM